MTRFAWGVATDTGRVRAANQDHAYADGTLFAVADGMGGHLGGEIASELALAGLDEARRLTTLEELVELVHAANDRIVERAREEPTLRGMGTTVCLLGEIHGPRAVTLGVANVGDSRLYTYNGTGLDQITEDHSLVEALVRDGRLTREDAARHPQRNILTRALGIDAKVLVDAWELNAVRGDRFLLCSDGLFNELTPEEIVSVLDRRDDPNEAADELVATACHAGGRDNVTALVVDVLDGHDGDIAEIGRVVTIRRAVPDRLDLGPGHTIGDDPRPAAEPDTPVPMGVDPHPDEIRVDGTDRVRFATWRLGLFVTAVLLVLAVLFGALVAYARAPFFVGVSPDGAEVAIYQGRPGGVLWFDPTVEELTGIAVTEVRDDDLDLLTDGVTFDSRDEADRFVEQLARRAVDDVGAGPADEGTAPTGDDPGAADDGAGSTEPDDGSGPTDPAAGDTPAGATGAG